MPRKIVPQSNVFPYHVSGRCHNREWYPIPLEDVWAIYEDYLYFIHHKYNVRILSFVLMSNHFHMIIKTPDSNLSRAMRYFMGETSRQIAKASGRINQIYGKRFSRTIILSNRYFYTVYKYVYRNPVSAKICEKVEDYSHSTLQVLLGKRESIIPLVEDLVLFPRVDRTKEWLNAPVTEKDHAAVRKALRKSVFKFPTDRNTGKPHKLSKDRY